MLRVLSETFEAIYEAGLDSTRWPDALQLIADCFDDVGTVLMFMRDDGTLGTIVSSRLEAAQKDYDSHWHLHDIRAARAVERGYLLRSDAVTDRHVVDDAEMDNHPIYTDFLARHRLGWFAGIPVLPHPRNPVLISIQRSRSKPPYSEAELALLVQLGRHVENALRVGIRLLQAESRSIGAVELLSALDYGVMILDSQGQVVFKNAQAQQAVLSGFSLRSLQERRPAAMERARGTPGSRAGEPWRADRPTGPIRVDRRDGHPFLVYALPITGRSETSLLITFAKAETLVLIIDPVRSSGPDPALLRDLLGLTLSEAKVTALIGTGTSPQQAAERLGLAVDTVRKSLKSVFSKVGVSRQSELVALLAQMHIHS